MASTVGNQFWKVRSKHGREKIFKTPASLWKSAVEYFDWVEANPLYENKVFQFQGDIVHAEVPKMRAMTVEGMCIFLGVNKKYLHQLEGQLDLETEKGKEYSNIISDIRGVIYQQKFQGAAADLLNANIIARDLGLKDKTETDHGVTDPMSELLKKISGSTIIPNAE